MRTYELPIDTILSEFEQRRIAKNYLLESTDERFAFQETSLKDLLRNVPMDTVTIDGLKYPVVAEFSFYGKGVLQDGTHKIQEFYIDSENLAQGKENCQKAKNAAVSLQKWGGVTGKLNQYNFEPMDPKTSSEERKIGRVLVDNKLIGYMHESTKPATLIKSLKPEFTLYAESFLAELRTKPEGIVLTGHLHTLNAILPSIHLLPGGDIYQNQAYANFLNDDLLEEKLGCSEDEARKIKDLLSRHVNMIIGTKLEELKNGLDKGKISGIEDITDNWQIYFTLLTYKFLTRLNERRRTEYVIRIPKSIEII